MTSFVSCDPMTTMLIGSLVQSTMSSLHHLGLPCDLLARDTSSYNVFFTSS